MADRIPVVLVAGFLGSGKTTLLNHLLRAGGDLRIGVVVNDFGAINIDSMLVAGQVDAMVSLGNGCVCCAVDVSELDEMFTRLTRPRADIDVIVVEASGLAEPRNLIRMVIGTDNPRIRYGGLVEVVDARHFPDTSARHPELRAHLGLADLVVLNKVDQVDVEQLDALRAEIGELAGSVPIYATTNGQVEPKLLFDEPMREMPRIAQQLSFDDLMREQHRHGAELDEHSAGHAHCAKSGTDHRHLHDDYTSVSFDSAEPLNPRALIEFMENPPRGLFRAKGFAAFAVVDERRKFVFHLVGGHIVFEPDTWARGEKPHTAMVFIGTGLAADEVTAALRATVHCDAEPLDAQTMLGVWRYTPH